MQLMTVDETAEYLKMSAEMVRRWLREKKLPGVKVGRKWLISKEDIDKLLNDLKSD